MKLRRNAAALIWAALPLLSLLTAGPTQAQTLPYRYTAVAFDGSAVLNDLGTGTAVASVTVQRAGTGGSAVPLPLTSTAVSVIAAGNTPSQTTLITGDTHTSTTVDNIASTAKLTTGQGITGAGFQAGTTISAISTNSITLSLATTTSVTGNTIIAVGSLVGTSKGVFFTDIDGSTMGDGTYQINSLTKSGKTYYGDMAPIEFRQADKPMSLAFSATGGVNVVTIAGQTVAASGTITFPAGTLSTLTQAQVTGGGYSLQTDGSGYLKLSSGTGTGQISLVSGGVALQSGQTVASVSGSVGSVSGNVGGNVSGSVGSVSGDVNGKVLGGGSSAFTGDGVQIANVATILTRLGSPTGASVSADISTLLTRIPFTLPTYPTRFSNLDINVSGYVTSTNGGGGGGGGLSSADIQAIYDYVIPNTPAAGSFGELFKGKLSPISFDGASNLNANAKAIDDAVKTAIVSAINNYTVDGTITEAQKKKIDLAIASGSYTVSMNTGTHVETTTIKNQAGQAIVTYTTTYDSSNRLIVSRTVAYSNL